MGIVTPPPDQRTAEDRAQRLLEIYAEEAAARGLPAET